MAKRRSKSSHRRSRFGGALSTGSMIGTIIVLTISQIFFGAGQIGQLIGLVAVGGLLSKAVGAGKTGLGALIGAFVTIGILRILFGGVKAGPSVTTTSFAQPAAFTLPPVTVGPTPITSMGPVGVMGLNLPTLGF